MTSTDSEEQKRVIKRYSNRKLYDTRQSRYVTLQQIGEMVREGEDVQIIDNKTKEDKTEVTLALILSEELKSKPRSVPLHTLRHLIQKRGEKLLSTLREGPIGRLIPGGEEDDAEPGVEVPPESREITELREAIDARIAAKLKAFQETMPLVSRIETLEARVATLEAAAKTASAVND